jgi:dipeptidase D
MTIPTAYAELQPAAVWHHFGALNAIPRPSRQEAAAREYVRTVARAAGAHVSEDTYGNVVVRVPASSGRESDPPVAIQAHLDMVCEKRPGVAHDFATDPIRPRREGDRIYASGTTLGADNGVGAALALATLTTPGLAHGPLELIFTVEEEIGLNGANALDAGLVHACSLINLDSEDPEELTVGCAGGSGAVFHLPLRFEPSAEGRVGLRLEVSGLQGGHSGVQIHERLANAIKLLTAALEALRQAQVPFRIASLTGGNAHNAIPRDASALLAVPNDDLQSAQEAIAQASEAAAIEWRADEPGLTLTAEVVPAPEQVLTEAAGKALVTLLQELPHGVLRMSEVFPGKVETSANLATVRMDRETATVATSTRSFVAAELERLQRELVAGGERVGARLEPRPTYPAWEPNRASRLLEVSERVYAEVVGHAPEVQVIHAGLECGIIAAKLPGMEAISFGPLIRGAHTPEEFVDIPSVEAIWRLLVALLAAWKRD